MICKGIEVGIESAGGSPPVQKRDREAKGEKRDAI